MPTAPSRDFLRTGASAVVLGLAALFAARQDDTPPDALIGSTEFRTDLPGGRHANVKTRRAVVVKADGTGRRVLAEELTREAVLYAVRRMVAGRQGGPPEPRLEE